MKGTMHGVGRFLLTALVIAGSPARAAGKVAAIHIGLPKRGRRPLASLPLELLLGVSLPPIEIRFRLHD